MFLLDGCFFFLHAMMKTGRLFCHYSMIFYLPPLPEMQERSQVTPLEKGRLADEGTKEQEDVL